VTQQEKSADARLPREIEQERGFADEAGSPIVMNSIAKDSEAGR
jgi:hypothetical protein